MRELFHTRLGPALREGSTWAAIGGAFGTLGTQIPAPHSFGAFVGAALAFIAAALLKDRGAA